MGLPYIVHYLDDYLFCGESRTVQCRCILQTFQDLARELGVPLAEEKTEGPCMTLTYLGVELDTIQQYSRLLEKLNDLRQRVSSMLSCTRVMLKELQEVVSHLNFACKCCPQG